MQKHYSKCSVFAFGFETRIKTILPLINRLISEALLGADHVSIICHFSSLTSLCFLLNMFLRVGFSRCLQAEGQQYVGIDVGRSVRRQSIVRCTGPVRKRAVVSQRFIAEHTTSIVGC